jgi:hypothetical protein
MTVLFFRFVGFGNGSQTRGDGLGVDSSTEGCLLGTLGCEEVLRQRDRGLGEGSREGSASAGLQTHRHLANLLVGLRKLLLELLVLLLEGLNLETLPLP